MGRFANHQPDTSLNVPTEEARPSYAATLGRGVPVSEVLGVPSLMGAQLVAGASGLHRTVQRLNIMEVPDILPWTKPNELLLTTGYPLREIPERLADLITQLHARRLAAVGVKLGRYLDRLPAEMLEAADRVGLPVIRLPDDVAFDDIINQVLTDILNRQAAVLARAEEVHRALVDVVLAGGGLDAITDQLSRTLDGTALVTAPGGQVLAQSPPPDAAMEADGPPGGPDLWDSDRRLRVERLKHGARAPEEGGAPVAMVPIVAGSLDHGRVVLIAGGRLLEESDVHVLERAATTAALVITKELAVSAVESKYRGDFLHDLLTGHAGDPQHAVRHCASLGWDIDRPLLVLVARPDPGAAPEPRPRDLRSTDERFARAWRRTVGEHDAKAAVVGYSRELVVVMGLPAGGSPRETVRKMVARLPREGGAARPFSTGISRVVTEPALLPQAYEQARRAAIVGRQMHGPGSVEHFDGLGVYRLLSLVPDSTELTDFMRETLRDLASGDDSETTDLRTTLEVLLDTNNVAETARILHFHYNTLRYRVSKLERLLGPFTTDPHLRLNLMLALQVQRMRGL